MHSLVKQFLDDLELAVENETSLKVQEELKGIKVLIDTILESKENYIKLEKAKLLDVLTYVDIKELTCPYLGLLGAQICSTGKKIEGYEDLSKKLDVSQKIDAYSKTKKVEKLFPLDKLGFNEVKIKIEIQEELLSMILNLFIHSLDKLSGKEIIDVGNILIGLGEKISKLEDINIY